MEQDSSDLMGSLEIDSLFTNIPFEETIEICTNNLSKHTEIVLCLKKVKLKTFSLEQLKNRISYLIIHNTNKLTDYRCPLEYRPLHYLRYIGYYLYFSDHFIT